MQCVPWIHGSEESTEGTIFDNSTAVLSPPAGHNILCPCLWGIKHMFLD